jgi:hypothetical protein
MTMSVAALSAAIVSAQAADTRISATWQVQKYDIKVNLPVDERSRAADIVATVEVRNVSGRPASSLTLRVSPSAEVGSVKINGAGAEPNKSEEKLGGGLSLQRLVMRLPSVAAGANVTAEVAYRLVVKENSGLSTISPSGTHFLPLSFWYPTPNSWFFPRGSDRAPFNLQVSSDGRSVLSAGTGSGGRFEQKLFGEPFFLAGNWEQKTVEQVSVFVPQGLSADALARAEELGRLYAEAVRFMSGSFGRAPDVPLRIVSSRRGGGFGSGGTLIVDEAVFRRPKLDSLTALNVAEAAARLWIGGSARVEGDGYGVITEGLVRYVADMFLENRFGRAAADAERLRQRASYAAISRRAPAISTISPLVDVYYPVVANKGAMIWRVLAGRMGQKEFFDLLRSAMSDGQTDLGELRSRMPIDREMLEYFFDKQTDVNLLAGLPRVEGGETKVALRNTGSIPVEVGVVAVFENGQSMRAEASIRPASFGEAVFKTTSKAVRVEIDADKVYPQTDYSDDVAPRESTDNDPILAAKRPFDRQQFAEAEKTASTLLRSTPYVDELRVILARSLLAQNKQEAAKREFQAVLDEPLPTARSMAWSLYGLADIAQRSGDTTRAMELIAAAILADADYGAGLAARNLRNRINAGGESDASVRAFFADFDRAASSNRKADLDGLAFAGEVARFLGGISGSTESWRTTVKRVDRLDANTLLVETELNVRLLGRNDETGMAVYRLGRSGSGWRLLNVEIFEVR